MEDLTLQNISRQEADYLRTHLPSAYIVITSKNKAGRAKRYAVEEKSAVKKCLEEYRATLNIVEYGRYTATFVPAANTH